MIPYGMQDINQDDIDAVHSVLAGTHLTQGDKVPEFEKVISDLVSAQHAVAVNSATSALHIACLSLGVGKGDLVWTSPISFVASSNCALYCGAQVDFVDIDYYTSNMCVSALQAKLEHHRANNLPMPKVVIPVHMAGYSCDMQGIKRLADEYAFYVIEDASHAIGAQYQNHAVGCCEFSDITVFSFHPVKIITTAEGGMATTNHAKYAETMRLLRSHGVEKNDKIQQQGGWCYEQSMLGFNYRMTDIQAALGVSQSKRLGQFINRRQECAKRYFEYLQNLPIELPPLEAITISSWHLFVIKILNKDRRDIFEALRKERIGVHVHYIPIYKQPYYQRLGFSENYCPQAERYYASALSIPIFHAMTNDQQDEVIEKIAEVLV
ncbi:MAG: UDP-4-amino-4,6-dideoxy-N-acetyl-beta-L-altrosamine transaminase [Gammaproteobacteria bacterium]|nr:UDP-4-amino-4,6-dideoxy-N-acetyl-beta-L-altrosamine transaminase [Gammaproteobacteria bacterium]